VNLGVPGFSAASPGVRFGQASRRPSVGNQVRIAEFVGLHNPRMTHDESPLHISTVSKLVLLDTNERGRGTQGVSKLLQRAAKAIAGLGAGSIEDLVLDVGHHYAVSWTDVYYTTLEGGSSAINHFNVPSAPGNHQQVVPELLHRTADAIAGLGDVEVEGMVLHENDDMDGIGRGPSIAVYYRERND
jgi:hypothetical protein